MLTRSKITQKLSWATKLGSDSPIVTGSFAPDDPAPSETGPDVEKNGPVSNPVLNDPPSSAQDPAGPESSSLSQPTRNREPDPEDAHPSRATDPLGPIEPIGPTGFTGPSFAADPISSGDSIQVLG